MATTTPTSFFQNGSTPTNRSHASTRNIFSCYSNFVHEHANVVKMLEGVIGNAFYFLPSRFNTNTEELYEVGSSVSRLLGVLNDSILANPPYHDISTIESHDLQVNEYSINKLEKIAYLSSIVLTLFDHGQILLELNALRRSQTERENLVIKVETIKLILRLIIIIHKRSVLLHSGSYVPPISPIASDISSSSSSITSPPHSSNNIQQFASWPGVEFDKITDKQERRKKLSDVYVGRRSGKCFHFSSIDVLHIKSLHNNDDDDKIVQEEKKIELGEVSSSPVWLQADIDLDTLLLSSPPHLNRVVNQSSGSDSEQIKASNTMINEHDNDESRVRWLIASEVLFFSRPLVQVVLNKKMQNKWKALLLTLTCDVLSLFCWMRSEQIRILQGIELSEAEKIEKQKRSMLYMFYLLRAPLWNEVSLPFLEVLNKIFEGVPLLSGALRYIMAFLKHNQSRHFHTEPI